MALALTIVLACAIVGNESDIAKSWYHLCAIDQDLAGITNADNLSCYERSIIGSAHGKLPQPHPFADMPSPEELLSLMTAAFKEQTNLSKKYSHLFLRESHGGSHKHSGPSNSRQLQQSKSCLAPIAPCFQKTKDTLHILCYSLRWSRLGLREALEAAVGVCRFPCEGRTTIGRQEDEELANNRCEEEYQPNCSRRGHTNCWETSIFHASDGKTREKTVWYVVSFGQGTREQHTGTVDCSS
jgi:hypothetical protein